jgi:hypothetical protein
VNRDVDLHHHFFEQRCGLKRADFLLLQPNGQRVDFIDQVGQRVFASAAAQAERKIFFADGRHHVRKRLQRADDLAMQHRAADHPSQYDEKRDGPFEFDGMIAEPEKKFGDNRAGQADEQRHQEDARIEIQLDPCFRFYGKNANGL